MNPCSVDIKGMIEYYMAQNSDSASAGGFDLYPIFIGKEPAEPKNTITIIDTVGGTPQLTFNKDEIYEYPSVQIRVRSTSYLEGWQQINAIKNVLHGRAEQWGNTYYSLVRCLNGPFLFDYDKEQRVRFILNFNCQRR